MSLTRRSLLATAAAFPGAAIAAGEEKSGLRARLPGAWRLLDAVTVFASGVTGPWYDRPGPYEGLIIYSASGAMSVQIASARPAAKSPPAFDDMAAADRLKYVGTYYAYFGRFEVNDAAHEVHHFVTTSLDPTETGATYVQKVELARDRLTLTTQPWSVHNELRHSRLTWVRD